jgi:hypothetical protein
MQRMAYIRRTAVVPVMLLAATAFVAARPQNFDRRLARGTPPLTVQASALAQMVSEIAGYRVSVPHARILWVVDAHALVVESDSQFGPTWRDRSRVLVLIQRGRSLAVPRPPIAIAPVTIVGVARTLLGIQAGHDVPWPDSLTRRELDRLDVRAAVLATSVQTADGVELTSSAAEP